MSAKKWLISKSTGRHLLTTKRYIMTNRLEAMVCFNEHLKKEIKESRYDEIIYAQSLLAKNKAIKPDLQKFFGKDGCTAPNKMVSYFCRARQVWIGGNGSKSSGNSHITACTAHVFICYLSYLLLSLLKLKLKPLEMSPIVALRELETLYKVYARDAKKDFAFTKTVALTLLQEKILKAVNKKLIYQM